MTINKKGISLIVLAITVIILAILSTVAILTLTDNGIINSAQDSIDIYELGQIRDLATVAWQKALTDPNIVTREQYLNYITTYLKGAGYTDDQLKKYTITASAGGVTVQPPKDEESGDDQSPSGGELEYAGLTVTKDTEGVTFTKSDGSEGDIDNLQAGDVVIYGDYEYRYKQNKEGGYWQADDTMDGWGVGVLSASQTKVTLGELCGSIYGKPVTHMTGTFMTCSMLTTAPQIPSSVLNMDYAYMICPMLTQAAAIPSSVTSMANAFYACSKLVAAPSIGEGVTNMNRAFQACEALETAPEIPQNVTDMGGTFFGCEILTGEIKINAARISEFSTCFSSTTKPITVKVPAGSMTLSNLKAIWGSTSNITIETF